MIEKQIDNQVKILSTPNSVMSLDYSTKETIQESQKLVEDLNNQYKFLSEKSQQNAQKQVINLLSILINEWSHFVAEKNKIPLENLSKYEAKLFTFGSYYLGVCSRDGDIDAIVVVPNLFDRDEHFFGDLYDLLKKKSYVTQIHCLQTAKVPILKMIIDNVPVDLSFTRLDMQIIDTDLKLSDNKLLANMDVQSVLSLNGRRVAEHIDKKCGINMENFRASLQLIKLWAKSKGIYTNMMGYLGGISWAILVAKICQMFPNYSPIDILIQFFTIYSKWNWHEIPIIINEVIDEPNNIHNKDQFNKKPDYLKNSKMHIITPAFPCYNSSQAVTDVGLNVLKRFLNDTSEKIENSVNGKVDWQDIFKQYDFFNDHEDFIQIDILSKDTNLDEYNKWVGFVQSKQIKLGQLFQTTIKDNQTNFQNIQNRPLSYYLDLHLYPTEYKNYDPQFNFCISQYYGLKLKPQFTNSVQGQFNLYLPVQKFIESLTKDDMYQKNKKTHNLRIFRTNRQEIQQNMNQNKERVEQEQITIKQIPLISKKIIDNNHDPINKQLYQF